MDSTTSAPPDLNLTAHRSPQSVWDKRGWNGTRERLAISRLLLGVGGGALAIQAARQGTWTGRMLAGLGGGLAWWALTGEGDLSEARRRVTQMVGCGGNRRDDDKVLQASAASFPASDPPAWTPTVGTGLRRDSARR